MITFTYRQINYMQLAIQRQTKENQLAIKKSFCRNAKLCFKRTQRTKPNYLKNSKRRAKSTEHQSSGIKIKNTPALYLTTNNVSQVQLKQRILPYCNPFPLVKKKRNRASGFFNKGAVKSPDNKAKLKSIFTGVFFNSVF